MALPTNFSRPQIPYIPQQSLPNNSRFGLIDNRPPTADMFDSELNALTDDINILADAINNVQAGAIIGVNNPLNANKFLTTDGRGNTSFTLVTNVNITNGAVTSNSIANGAVNQLHLSSASVISSKIADGAVTASKIQNASITQTQMANLSIGTPQIINNAITNSCIAPLAVTADKISSEGIAAGLPLVSQNGSATTFSQVSSAGIANGAVTTQKLVTNVITTPCIAPLAVTPVKINSSGAAVGLPLISQNGSETTFAQVPTAGIADGAVTINKLDPALSKGRIIAAGTFPLVSTENISLDNCFGVTQITAKQAVSWPVCYLLFIIIPEGKKVIFTGSVIYARNYNAYTQPGATVSFGQVGNTVSNSGVVLYVGNSGMDSGNAFVQFQAVMIN